MSGCRYFMHVYMYYIYGIHIIRLWVENVKLFAWWFEAGAKQLLTDAPRCVGCDQCSTGSLYRQDKVRFCDKYNNKYPRHAQAVAPSLPPAWPKTHPNSFRQLLSLLLGRGTGEGLPEKMRTDCRIRNGSCYNDANDTSSQMLKFSVAPELAAPSTAVTADESFGSGSLPRYSLLCLAPTACLPA